MQISSNININKPMKYYCDAFSFLISEFNIINLKYEQFKRISVPSESESSTGPNMQKLSAHIQQCRHEKISNKGELFQCCGTLF